jgi:hypothetical protein
MSEAKLVFTTDIKQVERDNAKLIKQNAQLQDSLRKMKDGAVAMGDAWTRQLQKTAVANDKWVAGLNKIQAANMAVKTSNLQLASSTNVASTAMMGLLEQFGGAISVATAARFAYTSWRSETDLLVQSHRKLAESLVKVVSLSSISGPKASKFLAGIKGATREQGTAALSGVTQAQPFMPQDRQFALAEQAARQAPTGVDVQQFGGAVADVGAIAPGHSADDVADLTVSSQQIAGEKFEALRSDPVQRKLAKMVAGGMSPEEAMANAIVALDEDASGRMFLAGKANPNKEKVASTTAQLRAGQATNSAQQRLDNLATFPEGQEALANQTTAITADQAGRATGAQQSGVMRQHELDRAIANQQGGMAPARAAWDRMVDSVSTFANEAMPSASAASEEQYQRGKLEAQRLRAESSAAQAQQMGIMTPEQAQIFLRQEQALRENTAALREQNRRHVNINGHVEP